jgi:serine protease Do
VVIGDRAEVWKNDPRFSFYRENEEPGKQEGEQARFGIYVQDITRAFREEMQMGDEAGILVTSIEPRSFADEIGLRERDIIVSINRQEVTSVADIQKLQAGLSPGDAVAFRVLRPVPDQRGGVNLQSRYLAGRLPE